MALAAAHRRLSMEALKAAMDDTTRLTIMVIFLLIGSTTFTLVFRGLEGDLWIADMLTDLPGGSLGFLLVVNAIVFGLGFFIDFFEIAFIIVPLIVAPAQIPGHRPDVVGDRPGREHPDVLPHSPIRFFPLLPQGGGTTEHSYDHDLPGSGPVHRDPVDRAWRLDHLGVGEVTVYGSKSWRTRSWRTPTRYWRSTGSFRP